MASRQQKRKVVFDKATIFDDHHQQKYCTPINFSKTPRSVKTTKMETKMVSLDQFVKKQIKKTVMQLVMKNKLQRTVQVYLVDKKLSETQTMVE